MQQPKIVFLGTGGDAIVVGKQLKASGGIVLQVDDNQLHLDPGPGALARAAEYNINPRCNIAVLCSHAHINHCNDVNAVIHAMSLGGLDSHGVFIGNSTIINGNEKERPFLTEYHKKYVEKVIVLEPGQRVGINNIEIKATSTKHQDTKGIGFRILTPNFNLGYTSDTSYIKSLVEEFKDIDMLVLNVPKPSDNPDEFNLCTNDAAKLISEIRPKLAIMTHYGIKMLEADPLSEARIIQRDTGIQTIAARDGMVINPISYDVNLRQKTLNLFQR